MIKAFIFQQQPCRCANCQAEFSRLIASFAFRPILMRMVKRDGDTLPPVPDELTQARLVRYLNRHTDPSHSHLN